MISTWDRLEGAALAGQYVLEQWLGDSADGAFFLTAFGPAAQPAVLKLIPLAPAEGERQLELWRCTARLSHPHLLRLLDFGRTDVDGNPFLYAVFERPDDHLAEAGRLTAAETRDVLIAALEALQYIHSQGLVHTSVDPGHVVALGNQIKLSSDTLCEPSRFATTTDDVRSLGALVYRLLTGLPVEPGKAPDLSSIPDPLRAIVSHSLDHDPNRRWTLAQIAEALRPAPRPQAAAPVPAPPPPLKPAASSSSFPKWAYVAIAALVAVLVFVFAPKAPTPQPAAQFPATGAAAVVPPPPAEPSAPPKVAGREYWRVIVYTYAGAPAAEKKAQSIHARWPAVQAEVFAPNGPGRPPYLVALGGRMTRDEAVRLLKIARGKGMPRDIYIQNYAR
jgi:hypothetical protein